MSSETFADQLLRLRKDRGYGRNELSRRTVKVGDLGVADATIVALERNPDRRPDDSTVLALGEALQATDEEFPAYALAKARRHFDEHEVGVEQALANLRALSDTLDVTS